MVGVAVFATSDQTARFRCRYRKGLAAPGPEASSLRIGVLGRQHVLDHAGFDHTAS
jgi:hypothetical protein